MRIKSKHLHLANKARNMWPCLALWPHVLLSPSHSVPATLALFPAPQHKLDLAVESMYWRFSLLPGGVLDHISGLDLLSVSAQVPPPIRGLA